MLAVDACGSNSTRTESCVAICVIPGAQTWLDAPKAVDCNGYHRIIHPSWEMRAGLKILVRIPAHSGSLQRIPAHSSIDISSVEH